MESDNLALLYIAAITDGCFCKSISLKTEFDDLSFTDLAVGDTFEITDFLVYVDPGTDVTSECTVIDVWIVENEYGLVLN